MHLTYFAMRSHYYALKTIRHREKNAKNCWRKPTSLNYRLGEIRTHEIGALLESHFQFDLITHIF